MLEKIYYGKYVGFFPHEDGYNVVHPNLSNLSPNSFMGKWILKKPGRAQVSGGSLCEKAHCLYESFFLEIMWYCLISTGYCKWRSLPEENITDSKDIKTTYKKTFEVLDTLNQKQASADGRYWLAMVGRDKYQQFESYINENG